jgi:hypothetical protein
MYKAMVFIALVVMLMGAVGCDPDGGSSSDKATNAALRVNSTSRDCKEQASTRFNACGLSNNGDTSECMDTYYAELALCE